MANTAANQTTERFVTTGKVSFRNLIINHVDNTFSVEYAFLEGRKRKFQYEKATGHITKELRKWFCNKFNKPESTETTTAFRLWLERKGIEFKKGIIRELEFTCDNKSPEFDDCPFWLSVSEKYGSATLYKCNENPKKVSRVIENPDSGEEYREFERKYMFRKPDFYNRLVIYRQK